MNLIRISHFWCFVLQIWNLHKMSKRRHISFNRMLLSNRFQCNVYDRRSMSNKTMILKYQVVWVREISITMSYPFRSLAFSIIIECVLAECFLLKSIHRLWQENPLYFPVEYTQIRHILKHATISEIHSN